jgi:beta-lactam-binding protein with PASTA domain/tRNA A-37 threonylcarbamoyl transferase component Bud32
LTLAQRRIFGCLVSPAGPDLLGSPVAKHSTDVDHLVGRSLGRRRYEVVAHIARGGMATVYRAHDRQLDREVAIKVPRPEFVRDRAFCEQFRREARAAARLAHPGVVAVHDSGEERGLPFIVMELVDGQTLRALLESRGRLDPETTAALLGEIADALDHAHRHGIAHLDVKPENVLLTSDSVKVADFGLVRAAHGARDHALAGTAQYCAPEVLRGGVVDGRADVYSLGVVAYECLTGRSPFGSGEPDRVAWQVLHGRVPPPSRAVPGLGDAYDNAVWQATEPDPARRFARASEVAAAMGATRRRPFDQAPGPSTTAPPPSTLATTVVGVVAPTSPPRPAPVVGTPPVPTGAPAVVGGGTGTRPLRPSTGQAPRQRQGRGERHRRRNWIAALLGVAVLLGGGTLAWALLLAPSIVVPNLVGEDLRGARAALGRQHLRLAVAPATPSKTVAEGLVAEQTPGPGRKVHRWSAIRIAPSSGILLPDLKGQDPRRAAAALSNLGLRYHQESRPSASVRAGLVAGTRPAAGATIGTGDEVDLLVSIGRPRVEVPGVRGEDAASALAELRRAGFKTSKLQVFSALVPAGRVINTSPPPGLLATWGSTVQVYVSKGPDLVEVPDVRNLPKESAERTLQEHGLRWRYSFGFGGVVSGQDPAPGTRIPRGGAVRLSVSLF